MVFEDGHQSDKECPTCGNFMIYEMGFQDCFSPISGHYTIDDPLLVCETCDYAEPFEEYGDDDEWR